jgi:hypothetical protein
MSRSLLEVSIYVYNWNAARSSQEQVSREEAMYNRASVYLRVVRVGSWTIARLVSTASEPAEHLVVMGGHEAFTLI